MLVMSNIDNNAADDNKCSKLVKDKKSYRKCKNSRAVASLYCNLHLSLAIKSEKVNSKPKVDKEIPKESTKLQPFPDKYSFNSQCKFIKTIGEYKFRCRQIKLESSDYCKQHSTIQALKKAAAATSADQNIASKDTKNEGIKEKGKEEETAHTIKGEKIADKKLEKVEVAASSVEIIVLKQDKKVGKATSSVEKTKLKTDKKSKITDYITRSNVQEQDTSEVCSKPDSYKAINEPSVELEKDESTSLIESQNILGGSILRLESYLNTTVLTDSIQFSKRFSNKTNETVEVKDNLNRNGNGNSDGESNSIRFSKEDVEYKLIEDILINKMERIDFRELNRYNRNSINFIKNYRDF